MQTITKENVFGRVSLFSLSGGSVLVHSFGLRDSASVPTLHLDVVFSFFDFFLRSLAEMFYYISLIHFPSPRRQSTDYLFKLFSCTDSIVVPRSTQCGRSGRMNHGAECRIALAKPSERNSSGNGSRSAVDDINSASLLPVERCRESTLKSEECTLSWGPREQHERGKRERG